MSKCTSNPTRLDHVNRLTALILKLAFDDVDRSKTKCPQTEYLMNTISNCFELCAIGIRIYSSPEYGERIEETIAEKKCPPPSCDDMRDLESRAVKYAFICSINTEISYLSQSDPPDLTLHRSRMFACASRCPSVQAHLAVLIWVRAPPLLSSSSFDDLCRFVRLFTSPLRPSHLILPLPSTHPIRYRNQIHKL
jgi:hypothetical protein